MSRAPASKVIQSWIQEIPELQHDESQRKICCNACDVTFQCSQRKHITRHLDSERHRARSGLESQALFNKDLVEVAIACEIPWSQINNPIFQQFLQNCISGKYSNTSFPSDAEIGRLSLNPGKETILEKIGDNYVCVSLDVFKDATGRTLACVAVGALEETTPTRWHITTCKQLNTVSAETITPIITTCLRELWSDQSRERILLLLTDSESCMIEAAQLLKQTYPHMLHFTCLARALNLVATELISGMFPEVEDLIMEMKQVFSESYRAKEFREMLPHVPFPPSFEKKRWGTWRLLEAASYYFCYCDHIKPLVEQFHYKMEDAKAQSIYKLKQAFANPNLKNELSYIHGNFSRLADAIKQLEKVTLSATDAINVVFDLRNYIFRLSGVVGEQVKSKFDNVLKSNPGFSTMCVIVDFLNGKKIELSCDNDATLRQFNYFRYAPTASLDVERTFINRKWFTDKRKKVTVDNLELLLINSSVDCDGMNQDE